jgi:hypothetical protein
MTTSEILRNITSQFSEFVTAGDGLPIREHLLRAADELDAQAARIAQLEAGIEASL